MEDEKKHLETPPPQEEDQETVEVNKVQLEKLIQRVDDQDKHIERLASAADVARLSRYDAQHGKPLPKVVRVRKFHGKYVVAWKTTINEVEQNPQTGVWHERQEMQVTYEDGETETVKYKNFMLTCEMVDAELSQTTKDSEGNETLVVKLPEGKTLKIDVTFVN